MMTEDIEKKLDILLAVEKEDKEIIQGVSPETHEVQVVKAPNSDGLEKSELEESELKNLPT